MTDGATGIFDGLRVVELTTGMAGPMTTMVLADHGADVVKLEPVTGDWARSLPAFAMWNRQKRSVRFDPASDGRVLEELLAAADVAVLDADHDLVGRAGIDRDRVSRRNPGLVWCGIGGFGGAAPVPTVDAYEGIVAAATGRMWGLDPLSGGHPGRVYDEPAFTAAPVASFGASQLALHGVVAALLQRAATGRGQEVSTSLLQGALTFLMRQELGRGAAGERAMSPATHRGIQLCFLTAQCQDDRYIQMCARQDHHFRNWLTALGLGELLEDERYRDAPMGIPTVADVDELRDLIMERMRTRTQAEWMRVFTEQHDVGADPFLTPAEFLDHPDMVDNGRVVEVDDPLRGRVRQVGALVQMSATPAVIERPAPALGDADDEVRSGRPWRSERLPRPDPVDALDPAATRPPLADVTILEVAYYIAGPMATTVLAELGARVIKVEPPTGDPYRRTGLQSLKFVEGKESIALDLKHSAGRAVLDELVRRSDVVVHSFRHSAAVRLGLDPKTVLGLNPGIVHLYAASYGSNGPQRDRAAFHSTPNALSGGGIKQAGRGNPPVNDSYADPGSALGAATAIVLGLWARHRTGRGQSLETTMLTSTGYIHSADAVVVDGASSAMIPDADQRGLCSTYRLYRCGDAWVFVAAVRPPERRALLEVVGPVGEDDAALGAAIEGFTAARSADDVVSQLTAAGVPAVEVAEETFDEWLIRQGVLLEAAHPAYGEYWRIPAKVTVSGSAPSLRPACAVGEHSVELLRELDRSKAEIDALIAKGVSAVWPPT